MTGAIYQIVESFTASQEESVTRICQSVIRETHADLDASLARVAKSAQQLQQTQEAYADFMDRSMDRLEQPYADLQAQTEKTMATYADFADSSIAGIRQASAEMQKQLEKSQDSYLTFLNSAMAQQQKMLSDIQRRSENVGSYNEQMLGNLSHAHEESLKISEEQKATYQEYIRFMYQSIEQFSEVWEKYSEKIQAYSDEISRMGPVQGTADIRRELAVLSSRLEEVLRSQSEAAATAAEEPFMKELMEKIEHLEELSSQPALFRRKKAKKGDKR